LVFGTALVGGGAIALEGGKKLSKAYSSYKEKQLYDLESVLHNESGDSDPAKGGSAGPSNNLRSSSGRKDSGGSGGGPSGSDMGKAAAAAMSAKQVPKDAGKRFKVGKT